jgi:probable F420-dependent oxidoreductase
MTKIRIGCQIRPQFGTMTAIKRAWQEVEELGADTLFTWDHFFPLPIYGAPDGPHFEGYTQLAAMAALTSRVEFGMLVSCNSYRNPNLLADMARTVDHISDGRHILGVGSGWFERDYVEYGYDFKTAPDRLRDLDAALPIIKDRLTKLDPGPVRGSMPIMIGGGGEKVTLRIVAEHADIWNALGTPEELGAKNAILNDWCHKIGRNPAEIERSVLRGAPDVVERADDYVAAGITHIIAATGGPDYDMTLLKQLLAWRDKRG